MTEILNYFDRFFHCSSFFFLEGFFSAYGFWLIKNSRKFSDSDFEWVGLFRDFAVHL